MRPDIKTDSMVVFIALTMLLGMTGCAPVGPDYAAPEIAVSGNWQTTFAGNAQPELPDPSHLACWWANFNDPILSGLIERAIAEGLDVQNSLARLREARARYGISDAALFPNLDLSADATWSRSGNDPAGDAYGSGLDAGWELDLFGGLRRAKEAAEADLQADAADLYDVMVSLTAEVGLGYVDLRMDQARLAVTRTNIDSQQETHDLIQGRYSVGLSNELDLQQARYNLESTRSRVPSLLTSIVASRNRLAVLTGQAPGKLDRLLAERQPLPVAPVTIAVGVPADMLQRRPDIRRAERELAAQTARIGEAEAERYPQIRLSGSIGIEASKLADLFESGTLFWNHGPRISWPIFDASAIRNAVNAQEALQAQARIAYESAVLEALEEVENAMTAFAQEQLRRLRLAEAAEAAECAEKLARGKYMAGLIDFSEVLEAQRSLLSFQEQLVESDGTITANLIRLYKALGGGWKPAMTNKGIPSP
ncbi:efflux transporter outer membrane subunit [Desulfosarcina ovata]|nr:efflux transporter outer membrane subunit [Desulfosarcina ovata]